MKRTVIVALAAFSLVTLVAACSSAPPPSAAPSGLDGTASPDAEGAGPGGVSAEEFDLACGSSSRLPRVIEKPLTSMGRSPRLAALPDGGFLVAGEREGSSVSLSPPRSVVIVRLDSEGTVAWEITLVHPAGRLAALAIAQTPDGGFAVLGRTELTREARSYGWLTKLGADGKILWRDFFDATSGMDAGKADRFLPKLAPYAFERLEITESGRFVLSGAGGATAEIDTIGALGKIAPGGGSEGSIEEAPAARLPNGGKAVVATLSAEHLGRSCLKLRVLDADGKLRAEEPLAAETQPGDRAAVAAVGAYKVAVAFADVGALVLVVFQTER